MIDRRWIGLELKPAELMLERGRLRAFAKAIGETDPTYTDLAAAHAAGYADLPAPPTFLFCAELDGGTIEAMLDTLNVPIARILHGEQGFIYHRQVCAGESVTVRSRITEIFSRKNGKLEFIVKTSTVHGTTDMNDLVAELRSVVVVRN